MRNRFEIEDPQSEIGNPQSEIRNDPLSADPAHLLVAVTTVDVGLEAHAFGHRPGEQFPATRLRRGYYTKDRF